MPQAPPTLPDGVSQFISDAITSEGFTYKVEHRFDLADIKDGEHERIQIRAETVTNPQQVRRLLEATRNGAKFDLICVTRDGHLVFGNHRVAAYRKLGFPNTGAIVIDVNAEDADEETIRRLRIVGYRENSRHGLPNSKPTVEMAVVDFRVEGWDNSRIARELGVASTRVSEIVAVSKGREALRDLGIKQDGITKSVVGAIGRASEALHDRPFGDLAKLAADARLTKAEVNTLTKAASEARSDDEACRIISDERAALRQRVSGADAAPHPSYAAQLRQKLGFIVAKAANPQLLVEGSMAHRDEHLAMVEQSISVLTAVRDLMVEAEEEAIA